MAAEPLRIVHDGAPPDFIPRDGLRVIGRRRSHDDGALGHFGIKLGKSEREHAAHAAARDGMPFRNSEHAESGACARTMSRRVTTGKSEP